MSAKKWFSVLAILVLASMIVSACGASASPLVVEKVVTQVVEKQVVQTQVVEKVSTRLVQQTQVVTQTVAKEDYTTPDPILSDVKVRQAIALCSDRAGAIKSVYPFVTDQKALLMDTFLTKTHWAYGGPYLPDLSYNPDKGKALLDEAGWKLAKPDDTYRTNKNQETLAVKFTTTDAQFRQTWSAVVEQSLKGCGIQLLRNFVPASWWFGSTSGLQRRDFQLGAYAWVGEADPKGQTLYACNQIPLPSNNWVGQNYMGWCNKTASDAVIAANNTLNKDERKKFYNIVQQEFVKDMVSLPMFNRVEAEAWGNNFLGLKPDPTEYGTASVEQWSLKNNKTSLVIGFSQEPPSMYAIAESAAVQREVNDLVFGRGYTQFSYDYQPWLFELSTLENKLATNNMVDVKAGDMVWNTENKPEKLAKGTKIIVKGAELTYDGASALQLPQLVVTYKMKNPLTWSDGQPVVAADLELGYKQDCNKDSGALDFTICDATQKAEFSDTGAVVTYLPGYQASLYFLGPAFSIYPAHEVLKDGRKLADVPAKEWSTLPEIAEKPMGYGPYILKEWNKGQNIKLTVNPNYKPAPKIKDITIVIIADTNQAKAQLLSGDVDWLEKATLGADFGDLITAGKAGKIGIQVIASPTWEHIDFNLFTK